MKFSSISLILNRIQSQQNKVTLLKDLNVKMMIKCIELCFYCADVCRFAKYITCDSSCAKQICETCAKVCEACAKVCEACAKVCERDDMDHCKQCSQVCYECAKVCRTIYE